MPAHRNAIHETAATPEASATLATGSRRSEAAVERVMSLADFERAVHSPSHSSFHLERMGLLLERLGNPQSAIPAIHIAGSKGKGSTAAMVASILMAHGCSVGLYTSPHLHSVVERIRIGLTPIDRQEFAALVERIWPVVECIGRQGGYGGVSTFELLTAAAFLYFKLKAVDVQVIEVGLGGRLDSTNVVIPEVSVITSISVDHTSILGNTVREIAFEKAGIIKARVPVVVAPQMPEAMRVLHQVAAERHAPLVQADMLLSLGKGRADIRGQSFEVRGPRGAYKLWIPLLGDHQLENAITAIAAVETIGGRGMAVSRDSIVRGLARVEWPGRLEMLSGTDCFVVVDGAHNRYSMMRLTEAIRQYFPYKHVTAIFGALSGHRVDGMLSELARLSPSLIAVRSRHPRALPSKDIEEAASQQRLPVPFVSDNIGDATRRALAQAGEGELVLGTGSLSVAAEIIEEIKGIPAEVYPNIRRPSVHSTNGVRPR